MKKTSMNIFLNLDSYDKHRFYYCLLFTVILGFIGYGYAFTNYTPAHDGMMTVAHDGGWQISLGRGIIPIYVYWIRGRIVSPWLIGVLNIIYTAIAVYLTVDMLGIMDNCQNLFIISSIYVLNISYICAASVYMFTFDFVALSLLLSVAAVFVFVKIRKRIVAITLAAILLSFSIGLYQSFFAVTIALFMIIIIQEVLYEKTSNKKLLLMSIEEISVAVLGSIVYAITTKIIQVITHYETIENYNSINNLKKLSLGSIVNLIPKCYYYFISFFVYRRPYLSTFFSIINICIFVIGIASYVYLFLRMKSKVNRIVLILLFLLFPLGCNCIYILTSGMIYYLMVFSFQLVYILLLMPVMNNKVIIKDIAINKLILVSMVIMSFIIVKFSNDILYYQKLVGEGTEASITNILYDIERCKEFDKNRMQIVIAGSPSSALKQEYEMQDVFGSYPGIGESGTTITYDSLFGGYLNNILGRNYEFDYSEEGYQKVMSTKEYADMSVYPKEGYLKVINDRLVIRFQ